jgi:hypothetical protein
MIGAVTSPPQLRADALPSLPVQSNRIIVPDGGGDGVDWVIALIGDAVKVVEE